MAVSLAPETSMRMDVPASATLANNAERALWAAHTRAAQLLDDEPGPISRTILGAVNQCWRQAFLATG